MTIEIVTEILYLQKVPDDILISMGQLLIINSVPSFKFSFPHEHIPFEWELLEINHFLWKFSTGIPAKAEIMLFQPANRIFGRTFIISSIHLILQYINIISHLKCKSLTEM